MPLSSSTTTAMWLMPSASELLPGYLASYDTNRLYLRDITLWFDFGSKLDSASWLWRKLGEGIASRTGGWRKDHHRMWFPSLEATLPPSK